MDLVGACRAFVSVSTRESFTAGAAAAGLSQPVASRRIAALEERLEQPLFERTSRRPVLTAFGRDLLPAARRLLEAADALEHEARIAGRRPWRLAVPAIHPAIALARLVTDARTLGIALEVRPAAPAGRTELLHTQQVRAALQAVPPDEAAWTLPLGLAGDHDPGIRRVHLDSLRPGRGADGPPRRVWVQPEDDVPHIRDPLIRLRDAVGLQPAQIATAPDLTTAAAEVLGSRDLLLCAPAQARELGLDWRPLGDLPLHRGYALTTADHSNPQPLQDRLYGVIAHCLGAAPTARAAATTATSRGPAS
ncbi:LysR family transcriptional regulator [Streptomyces sp. A7024]|uniref:LysR family transcriptional regulator n=1 Tax=Streptomyces coryli TaxID=1128680 RepID=A0A6G4UCU3_9ACTN|nr:LysR family transcriptional regulator [Streptomyces coryli]NGN69496.1 LysR family transcriptional regulator [Streptomyces coryli]